MSELQLTKLSNEPRQKIQYVLNDGTIIYLEFFFQINTNYWYLNIEYENKIIRCIQVVYNDTLLRQYQNQLPFDIKITSTTGLSPIELDSFKNGYNSVIIIDNTNA